MAARSMSPASTRLKISTNRISLNRKKGLHPNMDAAPFGVFCCPYLEQEGRPEQPEEVF